MKDYFDLLALIRENIMEPTHLAKAVGATFERRGTPVLESPPFGLSDEFSRDGQKQSQWQSFLKRNRLEAPNLEIAVAEIRAYVTDIKEI